MPLHGGEGYGWPGKGCLGLSLRERVRRLVETGRFQRAIMTVIVVNAITLGVEASSSLDPGVDRALGMLDRAALAIFVVELLLKLYAYRLRFFKDPWNCFDFVIVAIALVPTTGAFSVLRALRILRALRLISVVSSMRRVVAALLAAIPGVASIVALLVLVVYVSAVMATKMFGQIAPDHFGHLGRSLWTLFQVMTGEAWPEIADTVMGERPLAWLFFLLFILISTFVMLNLFLAVMVNAMETVRDDGASVGAAAAPAPRAPAGESAPDVAGELAALRREVAALRRLLDPDDAESDTPAPTAQS